MRHFFCATTVFLILIFPPTKAFPQEVSAEQAIPAEVKPLTEAEKMKDIESPAAMPKQDAIPEATGAPLFEDAGIEAGTAAEDARAGSSAGGLPTDTAPLPDPGALVSEPMPKVENKSNAVHLGKKVKSHKNSKGAHKTSLVAKPEKKSKKISAKKAKLTKVSVKKNKAKNSVKKSSKSKKKHAAQSSRKKSKSSSKKNKSKKDSHLNEHST